MVAAVSSTTTPKVLSRCPSPATGKLKRAPLLPSGTDNNGGPPLPRRPKPGDVTLRCLSSASSTLNTDTTTSSSVSSCSSSTTTTTSSSNFICTPRRRFPSPVVSRTNSVTPASAVNNKRDQSAERRHSGNPRTVEMSASAKMLTKTSARSLSVSFQGESFALPVSKVAKPASNGLRNGTPERRKAVPPPARASENSKLIDRPRWPGRSRQGTFMTMSVDFTKEKMKLSESGTAIAVRALRKSMTTENKSKHNELEIPEIEKTDDKLVCDSDNCNHVVSDTESTSSGSTPGNVRGEAPRAIMVPARFWQETINRLRRVQPEPVSPPLSKSNKLISGYKVLDYGPKLSPRGSSFSPVRGAIRPASPSKRDIQSSISSPSRAMLSSSSMPNGVASKSNLGNSALILSFSAEARRGKVGENKLVDTHVLRLLHNKHLQWRFANARIDTAMLVQRATAQKSLYNAWVTMSKMWQSVISKRVEIQQLKQNLKLHSILKKQMSYLDNWDLTGRDHSISLSGAILALESSTLRLPVLGGAKADVQNLEDAICSAVDVMQAMAASICSLVNKVEHVNSLASELASTTESECCLLDQCKDLFSTLTLLEVQDCSLRAHTLQLIPPGMKTGL